MEIDVQRQKLYSVEDWYVKNEKLSYWDETFQTRLENDATVVRNRCNNRKKWNSGYWPPYVSCYSCIMTMIILVVCEIKLGIAVFRRSLNGYSNHRRVPESRI